MSEGIVMTPIAMALFLSQMVAPATRLGLGVWSVASNCMLGMALLLLLCWYCRGWETGQGG